MKPPKICVVGAGNVDLTSYSERMPQWGETLRGDSFDLTYGGKGANQAVMAAKLGAKVSMVGKVGADLFGQGIIDNLKHLNIDVSYIQKMEGTLSGIAQIMVDPMGKNAIIVVTGASDLMTKDDVHAARSVICEADMLLVQWEIPIAVSREAMKIAREADTKVVFNPAPMGRNIPEDIFPLCDTLCVNETEISALTGMPVDDIPQIKEAALELIGRGALSVIVTLGKKGAFFASRKNSFFVEAQKVNTVDSTGAGDCFIGSFSYFLSKGSAPNECISLANKIAAISVQRRGTQTSYPNKDALSFLPK